MGSIELAGCVILDEYGRILLLHRATDELSQWELPGGKLEQDETAEQAAIRELNEELGIEVQLVKTLGSGTFEADDQAYRYSWFQAIIVAADPTLQETELFDDLDYFELEDMLSLALSANLQVLLPLILSGDVQLEILR